MTAEPLRPVDLSGTHAYADRSVFAGDLVSFYISSDADYRLAVYRLGQDPETTDQDIRITPEIAGVAGQQAIRPGSYVQVARPLDATAPLTALTLEVWIRPWAINKWQGLITQHNYPGACGVGLFLDGRGHAAFAARHGERSEGA